MKSFRSHPDIFQYSNDQFYNSELQSCGNPVITRSLINYEKLPKAKFPLIFHGIVGKDEREERSPSFFNVDEITLVKKYCVSLIGDKKNGISTFLLIFIVMIVNQFAFDCRGRAYWRHYAIPCSTLQDLKVVAQRPQVKRHKSWKRGRISRPSAFLSLGCDKPIV